MGVLARTADEADAAVSHTLVAQRKTIDKKTCQGHIDNMRGAVMIAYPAYHRLPAYDPTRLELENKEELDGASEYQNILEESQTSCWCRQGDAKREASRGLRGQEREDEDRDEAPAEVLRRTGTGAPDRRGHPQSDALLLLQEAGGAEEARGK